VRTFNVASGVGNPQNVIGGVTWATTPLHAEWPHSANTRILWLRSRERAQALKNTNYCCAYCGIKQSTAKGREVKLDVHHLDQINWDGLCDLIRERLLQTPERLAPAAGRAMTRSRNDFHRWLGSENEYRKLE